MLPKRYRLPLAKTTQLKGRRQRFEFFDLVIKPNEEKRPRFAVIISSRITKKAVVRNRTRRLILKALESLLDQIDNIDLLVIVKKDLAQFKSRDVALFFKEDLARAQVLK